MTELKREWIAGVTTFFTMSYIVLVNPAILSAEGRGIPFSGALTATVLLCFCLTLLMGIYAKLPYAVAPGMGINAFFTYTLVLEKGIDWRIGLGMVFWSGVLFLIASITPLREKIVRSIPQSIRVASAVGIGLFLTFIGLKNAGLVVSSPATFVRFGGLHFESICCLLGLGLAVYLMDKKKPYAFTASILAVSAVAFAAGRVSAPETFVSLPDFESAFLQFKPWDALQVVFIPSIVALMMTDFFDSISTFVGVSNACGLVTKDGEPKNLRQGLIVDAWATLLAGIFGTSAGTAYVESAAGIEAGGRTGRTAIATALCFLPLFFIAPLAGMVPGYATAPVLLIVGYLMFRNVTELKLVRIEEALPAFITASWIPLTFSITQGILWGLVSHTALHLILGKRRALSAASYWVGAVALVFLWLEHSS